MKPKVNAVFNAISWLAVLAMAGSGAVFAVQRHGWAWDSALYGALAGLAQGSLAIVAVAWLVLRLIRS